MSVKITVTKRDHQGGVLLQYEGETLASGPGWLCLVAYFRPEFADVGVLRFHQGDKMTEWFYADRFYNIFQVHEGDSDRIKGWYCNVARPAQITPQGIVQDDLALDVVVSPAGEITLLDEAEFEALPISPEERVLALDAIEMLHQMVARRAEMFAIIPPAPHDE